MKSWGWRLVPSKNDVVVIKVLRSLTTSMGMMEKYILVLFGIGLNVPLSHPGLNNVEIFL